MRRSHRWRGSVVAAVILLVLTAGAVQGSTVRRVGTSELIAASEVVFQGEVIERWSALAPVGNVIVTNVRFRIIDVIKGGVPASTLTLQFMGGELGGVRETVSGSSIPELGEQGVYFVESTDEQLVNPLYGWSQGRFQLKRAATGELRVYTDAGAPVTDFAAAATPKTLEITHGHAQGVAVSTSSLTDDRALTLEQFKAKLARLLEAGR